ncbi:hypothetical protein AVEN_142843-1 [Araneus ventricosus]|uniref:C-type lectin domain-containing protein n=1 Tax=Araneus ventricosus TaxID=182803 RepID=A0A4Y2S8K5_ARAVE|nr:hypothetical protein AVEN_206898-1 [Araneus ventricosus]GBN84566.1 hypothetical protein AVEN_140371-1 [Araneus ventricosus]GBN84708.1 hypothetical protein AVEN_274760-1 [Araneus ventricosus]GBN84724.1 hypothetical protein AVEN_142843-1 [Araneus ventricosus]
MRIDFPLLLSQGQIGVIPPRAQALLPEIATSTHAHGVRFRSEQVCDYTDRQTRGRVNVIFTCDYPSITKPKISHFLQLPLSHFDSGAEEMGLLTCLFFVISIFYLPVSNGYRQFEYCNGTSWIKFQGNCYSFQYKDRNRVSFYDADDYCRSQGAHLASIHSEAENEFILNTVKIILKLTLYSV